jgi:hypothetical protein
MTRRSLPANESKIQQSYLCGRVIQNGPKEEYQGSPAWLICLMVVVILTIGVRLTENVIQWESLRIKGALVAVAIAKSRWIWC